MTKQGIFAMPCALIHNFAVLTVLLCTTAAGITTPFVKNIHILTTGCGTECG